VVQVTDANARAAADAASRLLHDPFLSETLDEMTQLATDTAIRGANSIVREEARQEVLAIIKLRGSLQTVFESWQTAAAVLQQRRAHE
jgi:hypothetical protein